MATDYLFGINAVQETLIAAPKSVREVIVSNSADHGRRHALVVEARRLGLPVSFRSVRELDRLAHGQRHQGVVAIVEAYAYPAFERLLQRIADADIIEWILILDGIVDPRNFGALLRTAEAAGVRHVVIPKDRSVEVTPLVVKASAGAAHHLNIYQVTNLRRTLQDLKRVGYWTVGLAVGAKECLYDRVYPEKLAIVLGSEATGVRPINLRECDFLVSIPMLGKVASVNVAVAGAICLFEMVRQQRLGRL
ncbi:MAG TPA: 23S rRNA (guanosine(2251)-2'-O)-methyltransferase RlmB [Candidatus Binatia bacterium]|nr:23S rRNA (guanosine(2251)-2'-O)-methyltransferase RlmB [Candidatus Binatia bacterium]